jgi:hypothetical protein
MPFILLFVLCKTRTQHGLQLVHLASLWQLPKVLAVPAESLDVNVPPRLERRNETRHQFCHCKMNSNGENLTDFSTGVSTGVNAFGQIRRLDLFNFDKTSLVNVGSDHRASLRC